MWASISVQWNWDRNNEVLGMLLSRLVDIRPGEWRRLLPISLAYALVLASVYMLKPARNALFLDRLGIEQLPYVLVLVAIIGGGVASIYARFTNGVMVDRLIVGTFAAAAAILGCFYFLLQTEASWVYYLFYIWVNLYGLLAVSLLWLFANAVFHAREARRLFGFIGTGGIAGAVLGGLFTGWAVEALGTENLLLVCMGLLVMCMGLLRCVRGGVSDTELQEEQEAGAIEGLKSSALVRYMVAMVSAVAVIAAIADVQFNEIVNSTFPSKDEKTAFFGSFFAYLNGFAFLFQLFVTPRVLGRLGVGGGLAFLPVSVGLGALGGLFVPGIWGGVAVKVGDGGFRHSVHKAAFEVLFLPVPNRLKKRAKVFMDTTVDNLATGLGAILVLILTGILGMTYRDLSFLSLALVLVWIAGLWPLRKAYVDAFRQALDKREMQADDFRVQLADTVVIDSLLHALKSPNPRQVAYALDLLVTVERDISADLIPLLGHGEADIRARTLAVLCNVPNTNAVGEIQNLLTDDVPEVRLEAMHYLQIHQSDPNIDKLEDFLYHDDSQIRSAALGYVAVYGNTEEKQKIDVSLVGRVVQSGDSFERAQMARLLGVLDREDLSPYLSELKKDPSERVIRQTILSFGQLKAVDEVFWLLEQLARPPLRVSARLGLAQMGPNILDLLGQKLEDASTRIEIRRHIPRVIGAIRDQKSVEILMARMDLSPAELVYWIIKALSKLRASAPELDFSQERVDISLMQEIQAYYGLMQIADVFQGVPERGSWMLLNKAIKEHQDSVIERLFRLMGLLYAPQDMYHAYLGVVSSEKNTRAQALEFLENVLAHETKEHILSILDPDLRTKAHAMSQDLLGDTIASVDDGLAHLINGSSLWLKACAINCVDEARSHRIQKLVQTNASHHISLISETAGLVVRRLKLQA